MEADRNGVALTLNAHVWRPSAVSVEEEVTSNPSPDAVEAAIRRLNNAELHDVFLMTPDLDTFLGVSGGAGRYIVTISIRSERFAHLLNPDDPSDVEEEMMCGGQITPFPRRYLVKLATAILAALHYLETREAAPGLSWHWYT
jgi:hypothetical protein